MIQGVAAALDRICRHLHGNFLSEMKSGIVFPCFFGFMKEKSKKVLTKSPDCAILYRHLKNSVCCKCWCSSVGRAADL